MKNNKPVLRIQLVDFPSKRKSMKVEHSMLGGLEQDYEVHIDAPNHLSPPDILCFSMFGNRHYLYDCPKILFNGEPPNDVLYRLSDKGCDYAFSYYPTNEHNAYCPQPLRSKHYGWLGELYTNNYSPEILALRRAPKQKFCNFIYSHFNPKCSGTQIRLDFCRQLMQYKPVDCPAPLLNNMPLLDNQFIHLKTTEAKIHFISAYKFTIAFENISLSGYHTEKIIDPFLIRSIPIYWGDPHITQHYNPQAFINCHAYKNFEQVIEKIIEIDENDELYQQYINAPLFQPTIKTTLYNPKHYEQHLRDVVARLILPNYQTTTHTQYMRYFQRQTKQQLRKSLSVIKEWINN